MPLLIALAFFAWNAWRKFRPVESLRATALTTFAGVELDPSLSPDGNHVAFTWNGEKQDNSDVYVQMIGSGAPLRLTTHAPTRTRSGRLTVAGSPSSASNRLRR